MELLECCLKTTYFKAETDFFQQTDGLPMGSPLSPVIANIYMEYFEEIALSSSQIQPKKWIRYVDDTFIIWNDTDAELEELLKHINSIKTSIKFKMEKEENNRLPFLDVCVERENNEIRTYVYRKPTHTGKYLNFESNHAESTKIGVANTLLSRARSHCNTEEGYKAERSQDHCKHTSKQRIHGQNNSETCKEESSHKRQISRHKRREEK